MIIIIFLMYDGYMKTESGQKKALSHERILSIAARSVRRQGFRGAGVAEVMKEAGLTHGGFYSHFESRDELLARAVERASQEIAEVLTTHASQLRQKGLSAFRAFVETYLSEGQIADRENGCPVAALCGEFPNQAPTVVDSSRIAVGNLVRLVEDAMGKGAESSDVWAVTGALIGAMQLARTFGDNAKGRAVLSSARASLLSKYE
jgi:AcrR family transcriptional regulator